MRANKRGALLVGLVLTVAGVTTHASATLTEESFTIVNALGGTTSASRFAVDGAQLLYWPSRTGGSRETRDAESQPVRLALADCLAIFRDERAVIVTPGALLLADGQRFPGEAIARDAGGLSWRHRWLGESLIDLDRTRYILLTAGAPLPIASSSDLIVLANGDRIEGVIGSLGATVTIDRNLGKSGDAAAAARTGGAAAAAAELTEVPLVRIASIGLVTPPATATGPRLWTLDGTIVDAMPMATDDREIVEVRRALSNTANAGGSAGTSEAIITPAAAFEAPKPAKDGAAKIATDRRRTRAMTQRTEDLLGFAPDPARIVALADLRPIELRASGTTPRISIAPPLHAAGLWPVGLAPVTLRGPTIVRYEMPARGCTMIAEVRVADPDPRWTEFELILRDDGKEIFRASMDSASAATSLVVKLASERLEIEVTEGTRGPIRDAVEFRRAMVVLPKR